MPVFTNSSFFPAGAGYSGDPTVQFLTRCFDCPPTARRARKATAPRKAHARRFGGSNVRLSRNSRTCDRLPISRMAEKPVDDPAPIFGWNEPSTLGGAGTWAPHSPILFEGKPYCNDCLQEMVGLYTLRCDSQQACDNPRTNCNHPGPWDTTGKETGKFQLALLNLIMIARDAVDKTTHASH